MEVVEASRALERSSPTIVPVTRSALPESGEGKGQGWLRGEGRARDPAALWEVRWLEEPRLERWWMWANAAPGEPEGTDVVASGGALVTLTAGGRTQTRVIDGGSGYLCQMEPVAHFGLGSLEAVERVTIRWPSGATRVIEGPDLDATLEVAHPEK